MKRILLITLLSTLLPLSVFGQQEPAELILLDGKVFTVDPTKPSAEALAIRGERIIAVGTSAEIEKLAGASTRRLDLHGRTAVPGFNDAHFHFKSDPTGFTLHFQTLEPSWAEVSAALEQAVRQTVPGTWIFGSVGHEVVFNPEVTRFALDRIAPRHPVLLRAYYGHGYILNSTAMPLLQVTEDEPDPAGGSFERVAAASQNINGRLWEYADWKAGRMLANQVTDEDAIKALGQLADEAVRYGITSMQVMSFMSVDRFARLLVKADVAMRVRAIPLSLTTPQGRDLSEIRQLSSLRFPQAKVTVSGIKWVLDGTPIERGAAVRQPYHDRPGWRGKLNFSEREIAAIVKESLEFNQQLLVHCAGDKPVEVLFNAMEGINAKSDWGQKRVRVEHGDGVIGALIPRARRLGVIVVQNPSHFTFTEIMPSRYGSDLQFFPLRSLLEARIPVAFGSDGPLNPYLNIMFAVLHPLRPTEAITREQAVEAYTRGSAFAEFAEGEKGTISKGKLADVVVLSQYIFTAPVSDLPKTSSVLTIIGGKIVYDAKVLQ